MRKLNGGICLAALAFSIAFAGTAFAKGKNLDGKQAIDFAIEEMSYGDETSLTDFEGKVILLEFWFLG